MNQADPTPEEKLRKLGEKTDSLDRVFLWFQVAAIVVVALILFWPTISKLWRDAPPAIVHDPIPVANVYTWSPSVNCGEGFAQLKIHLEPGSDVEYDTVFIGCGAVLTAEETWLQGDTVDLVVR